MEDYDFLEHIKKNISIIKIVKKFLMDDLKALSIEFAVEGEPFYLNFRFVEGAWKVVQIRHFFDEECCLCSKKERMFRECVTFNQKNTEIVGHFLLNHPEIRLRLLCNEGIIIEQYRVEKNRFL